MLRPCHWTVAFREAGLIASFDFAHPEDDLDVRAGRLDGNEFVGCEIIDPPAVGNLLEGVVVADAKAEMKSL